MKWIVPWLDALYIFGSQLIVALGIVGLSWIVPSGGHWLGTPEFTFLVMCLGGISSLLVVGVRLRCYSFSAGIHRLGWIACSPRDAMFSALSGIVFGVIAIVIANRDLHGVAEQSPLVGPFLGLSQIKLLLFATLLLVGPIVEEIVMRGFLYKRFRESFPLTISLGCTISIALIAHSQTVTASFSFFLLFTAFQAALCLFVERTRSLWCPILCHLCYNLMVVIVGVSKGGF